MKKKKVIPTKHTRYTRLGVKHAEKLRGYSQWHHHRAPCFPKWNEKKTSFYPTVKPPRNFPFKTKRKRNESENRQLDNVLHHQAGRKNKEISFLSLSL
jgi:hypothetical protein